MSKKTENLEMVLNSGQDKFSVSDINDNFEKVDEAVGSLETSVSELNSNCNFEKVYSAGGDTTEGWRQIIVYVNDSTVTISLLFSGLTIAGNNETNVLPEGLPAGISPKTDITAPCVIKNGSWSPETFGEITFANSSSEVTLRCKNSVSNAVIRCMFSFSKQVFHAIS